jgi:hypothetical protein
MRSVTKHDASAVWHASALLTYTRYPVTGPAAEAASADQLVEISVELAMACTPLGVAGAPTGIASAFDDHAENPISFFARTAKEYVTPLVRPVAV